jgi:hypothetical protein
MEGFAKRSKDGWPLKTLEKEAFKRPFFLDGF